MSADALTKAAVETSVLQGDDEAVVVQKAVKQACIDTTKPPWIDECRVDALIGQQLADMSTFWKRLPTAITATWLPL